MRKLAVTLLAALVVMVPALAVVGPAQAAPSTSQAAPAGQASASRTTAGQAERKKKARKKKARGGVSMGTWERLARCESGGRWKVDTGNGYYGGLQISPRTWNAFGGARFARMPHQATKGEQVKVGQRIKNGQGWGAWPSCSRKIGVR